MKYKLQFTPQFYLSCLLCLLPILIGLTVYDRLPEPMPSHWSFDGEVNDYSSKAFVVFGLPVIMTGINAFIWLTVSRQGRTPLARQIYRLLLWIVPMLCLLLQTVTIAFGLGYPVSPALVLPLVMGSVFVMLGNLLSKCRPGTAFAIKNAWTLASGEIWRRTHRLAGRLWVGAGFLLALNTFFGSRWLYIALIAAVACIPYLYSYILYRKGL